MVLGAAPTTPVHAQTGGSQIADYGDDGMFHGVPSSSIPEPSTLLLLGAGLGLLARKLRRPGNSRG
jgi:hypothetical protein